MDTLLPYYERELAELRAGARALAERYPRIAAGLYLSDDGDGDPDIERLIQSVALLTARVSMRLDDGYSGFAEKLLEAIYPHYRRPIPSCAIARIEAGAYGGHLERGKSVVVGTAGAIGLQFRTVYSVDTSAPDVATAEFHPARNLRTRSGVSYSGPCLEVTWKGPWRATLRVFVDGDPSLTSVLRDALAFGVKAVLCPEDAARRYFIDGGSVRTVGFEEQEGLLEDPAPVHPGLRLLREWLAFPEKFGFFDLVLPEGGGSDGLDSSVVLMLDPAMVGDGSRWQTVRPDNLRTRCTPMVNLFTRNEGVSPTRHVGSTFQIVQAQADHRAGTLVAVDSVVATAPGGVPPFDIPHFFAVRRNSAATAGPFWVAGEVDERTDAESIMFVDRTCETTWLAYGVSVVLTCCDGNRPQQIVCGTPTAEIRSSELPAGVTGRLITRPSALSRLRLGQQATWRLVSHLALGQSSLIEPSGGVLRELLELYLPEGSIGGGQVVRALVGIRQTAVTRWLPGSFPPTLARGTEIELSIDVTQLVGIGLSTMLGVLDVFFSQYAQVNSFTQLVAVSSYHGKELHRCRMRTGTGPLI